MQCAMEARTTIGAIQRPPAASYKENDVGMTSVLSLRGLFELHPPSLSWRAGLSLFHKYLLSQSYPTSMAGACLALADAIGSEVMMASAWLGGIQKLR